MELEVEEQERLSFHVINFAGVFLHNFFFLSSEL